MARYHKYKHKSGSYRRGRSRSGRYYTRKGCFPASALVLTPSQLKPISEINVGDQVVSFNCISQAFDIQTVCQRCDHKAEIIWEISFENRVDTVKTTAIHPFLTSRGWVQAQHLQSGDRLNSLDGRHISEKTVLNVCATDCKEPVYNLITTGNHTYIVEECIVHNYAYFRWLRTIWSKIVVDWKWRKTIQYKVREIGCCFDDTV